MSEYNIQMNKYNALNAGYDQLYPQPMKHANTHAEDGNDPITPSMIGTYNKTEIDTSLQKKVGKEAPLPNDNDANNAIENGWYGISSTANIPIQYGVMRVDKWYSGCIFQTAYEMGEANVIRRRYQENLGWQPWEWVNPPMVAGVEYRTVYRNSGKPVYVKLVACGYLPNATTKTIAYSDDDACYPIFVTGRGGGTIMPSNSFGGQLATNWTSDAIVSFWASGKTIYISCGGDRSSNSVAAIVFYGKTTD